jgi:hypothetical protein
MNGSRDKRVILPLVRDALIEGDVLCGHMTRITSRCISNTQMPGIRETIHSFLSTRHGRIIDSSYRMHLLK